MGSKLETEKLQPNQQRNIWILIIPWTHALPTPLKYSFYNMGTSTSHNTPHILYGLYDLKDLFSIPFLAIWSPLFCHWKTNRARCSDCIDRVLHSVNVRNFSATDGWMDRCIYIYCGWSWIWSWKQSVWVRLYGRGWDRCCQWSVGCSQSSCCGCGYGWLYHNLARTLVMLLPHTPYLYLSISFILRILEVCWSTIFFMFYYSSASLS